MFNTNRKETNKTGHAAV